MFSTFEQANTYLESLIPAYQKATNPMRLERITRLLQLLGNPQEKIKLVHVGGTSGKGSVVYFLSQLIGASGYKVGLHISPHLQNITERMTIDSRQMPEKRFVDYVNFMKPRIEQIGKELKLGKPTYFEVLVAIALDYFAKERADIAVIEVGMGGRLDATNVINPLISILTNVSLDHTEILGNTVQKIAVDKAGIIKQGSLVLTGASQPSVQKIISDKAAGCNAKVFMLGRDFDYKIKTANLRENVFDFRWKNKTYRNLKLSTPGMFQVENASLALAATHLLPNFGFKIEKEKIYQAMDKVQVPGRFEVIQERPLIILDGAHNPVKIQTFLRSLTKAVPNKKFIFLIAFKKDKDIEKMLRQLVPHAKDFVISQFSRTTDIGKRYTTPAEKIKQLLRGLNFSGEVLVERKSHQALVKAKKLAGRDDVIVVTGSLYLVGEIRDLFFPNNYQPL